MRHQAAENPIETNEQWQSVGGLTGTLMAKISCNKMVSNKINNIHLNGGRQAKSQQFLVFSTI